MQKKFLALVVGVLMLAGASLAFAATTKHYKSKSTLYASIDKLTGAHATVTGFAKDPSFGYVVVLFKSAGIGKATKTPVTVFTSKGSISGVSTSDNTAGATGITLSNGKLKFTTGTGAYKKVSGTGTFSGTENKSGQYTIKYTTNIKLTLK